MKRDIAILGLALVVALGAVVVFVSLGDDDEPSPVEKVELAAKEFPQVKAARCRQLSDRRFRCRVTRADRSEQVCLAGTDSDERLNSLSCRPAKAR